MTFDDSDGPLVAHEDVDPLDAETLLLEPADRAFLDDSEEPAVATEVVVAAQGNGRGQNSTHDPDLVTFYLNDVGRVALLTHERERELIASLRAMRAAFVGIAIEFPAVQEAILGALEPLLHSRMAKSPAVASELIDRTELFRTLHRLHRTAGCRRGEATRPLTRKLAGAVRRLLQPLPIRGDFLLGILPSLTATAEAITRTRSELDTSSAAADRNALGSRLETLCQGTGLGPTAFTRAWAQLMEA